MQTTTHKRRKTQSLDISIRASPDQGWDKSASLSISSGHNGSHSSFCQADDEFNVAIRDVSGRTHDAEDEEDEEEICATPAAPPTTASKRDRFKSSVQDQTSRCVKITTSTNPTLHKTSFEENNQMVKIKCEPISDGKLSSTVKSPLRGIENVSANQYGSTAQHSTIKPERMDKESKFKTAHLFDPPSSSEDCKSKLLGFIETRNNKESSRKSLSLTTRKPPPRLKQSTLQFYGNNSTNTTTLKSSSDVWNFVH